MKIERIVKLKIAENPFDKRDIPAVRPELVEGSEWPFVCFDKLSTNGERNESSFNFENSRVDELKNF